MSLQLIPPPTKVELSGNVFEPDVSAAMLKAVRALAIFERHYAGESIEDLSVAYECSASAIKKDIEAAHLWLWIQERESVARAMGPCYDLMLRRIRQFVPNVQRLHAELMPDGKIMVDIVIIPNSGTYYPNRRSIGGVFLAAFRQCKIDIAKEVGMEPIQYRIEAQLL